MLTIGTEYHIVSEVSGGLIASGIVADGDTAESILTEGQAYVRRNCAFPVKIVLGGQVVWTNREEF